MIRALWNTGRDEAAWLRETADAERYDGPSIATETYRESVIVDLDDEARPLRRMFVPMTGDA